MSEQINNTIKESFAKLSTKSDLLDLLNSAKISMYGKKAKPISITQLNYYAFATYQNDNCYQSFEIKKKSGGTRTISAPVKGLKAIQRSINYIFEQVYRPDKSAYGFVKGKSVVDNASVHTGQHYVYNIDLKDFFPSIDQQRIFARLKGKPFCLPAEIATIISNLCCRYMPVERKTADGIYETVTKSVLPQGAPTSPILSNIICERLDKRMSDLSRSYNVRYTRYADDMTFSSMYNTFKDNGDFVNSIHSIIEEEHFRLNTGKTRLQSDNRRQEVTGLIVNSKVNVYQTYVKYIRVWLHLSEKIGLEKAQEIFAQKIGKRNIISVLEGKLLYLKMVKGIDNPTYVKLQKRMDKLISKKESISSILDVWEKEGMDKAMDTYYSKEGSTPSLNKMSDTSNHSHITFISCSRLDKFNEKNNSNISVIFDKDGKAHPSISTFDRIKIYCSKKLTSSDSLQISKCKTDKDTFWLIALHRADSLSDIPSILSRLNGHL
jgi:Reverse transcriptase (RNA-dependent DNA polymerase).